MSETDLCPYEEFPSCINFPKIQYNPSSTTTRPSGSYPTLSPSAVDEIFHVHGLSGAPKNQPLKRSRTPLVPVLRTPETCGSCANEWARQRKEAEWQKSFRRLDRVTAGMGFTLAQHRREQGEHQLAVSGKPAAMSASVQR
ncbi:hypothetical protein [Dokdonella ginsengisoli]|uniref:Uncharacterized protein n=1 Tax=Dokdonella ginsengisoli TaxID=363846 RepID=A0ABV9QR91_9GAMM